MMADTISFRQKYLPESLSDYVFPDEDSERLIRNWIRMGLSRPLLLFGETGTGKTSLGRPIFSELFPNGNYKKEFFKIQTDPLHDPIKQLKAIRAGTFHHESFDAYKVLLLDEIHNLKAPAQESLNLIINEHLSEPHLVLTTNHIDKLIPALKSRCKKVPIGPPDPDGWLQRCKNILELEGITPPSDKFLERIIKIANGDGREILDQLEDHVCDVKTEHPQS